ncbi:MAG: GspH/FimT family pseudopilin [Desulfobacteraceae bacterium]|nr:GspH/FimT family pseudopilin [Desulfobacteraceae bacterium]
MSENQKFTALITQSESTTMRKNSGFTLMELMTTIAIIAILASVAIPNMIAWLPDYRLRSGAAEMLSALQLALLTAIRENADVVVELDTGSDEYVVYLDNGAGGTEPGNGAKDPDERVIKSGKMAPDAQIDSAGFSGGVSRVSFTGRGLTKGFQVGTVTLKNSKGHQKEIVVNMTGRCRIK